jgi:hypothetical protein
LSGIRRIGVVDRELVLDLNINVIDSDAEPI